MNRRNFLLASAALAATLPRAARGIGPAQLLRLMALEHGGRWQVHPGALTYLSTEIGLRTSVAMHDTEVNVRASDPRLSDSMLLFASGTGAFRLSREELSALERWLGLGGLIVFDNAGITAPDMDFDRSVRETLGALFPQSPIERVSPEHVLFRSFYRLDYPAGRAIHKPYVEGVRLGPRYCAFILHNDLLGAMATRGGKSFLHTPTPGGENQREMAVRLGVNVAMYATCLHYKDDQVHIDYLLHKRKWKIRRPQ